MRVLSDRFRLPVYELITVTGMARSSHTVYQSYRTVYHEKREKKLWYLPVDAPYIR